MSTWKMRFQFSCMVLNLHLQQLYYKENIVAITAITFNNKRKPKTYNFLAFSKLLKFLI